MRQVVSKKENNIPPPCKLKTKYGYKATTLYKANNLKSLILRLPASSLPQES